MKKIIYLLITILLYSCDPNECLETKLFNRSNSNLEINFVSHTILEKLHNNKETLKIESNNWITYEKINVDNGLGRAGLSLIDFDSIYLSKDNEILKIWKPETTGKNIYDIENHWNVQEKTKDNYIYTFEITNEDLE